VLLDGIADVADAVAGDHLLDALEERLAGGVEQRPGLVGDLADRDGARGVSVVAAVDHAEVELHQVAVDELALLARDAVDDLFVDARAQHAGEAQVALEGRLGALLVNELFGELLEVPGRHARSDRLLELVEDLADDPAGVAHHRDLVLALDLDGGGGRHLGRAHRW
jgi:hypothetical protein